MKTLLKTLCILVVLLAIPGTYGYVTYSRMEASTHEFTGWITAAADAYCETQEQGLRRRGYFERSCPRIDAISTYTAEQTALILQAIPPELEIHEKRKDFIEKLENYNESYVAKVFPKIRYSEGGDSFMAGDAPIGVEKINREMQYWVKAIERAVLTLLEAEYEQEMERLKRDHPAEYRMMGIRNMIKKIKQNKARFSSGFKSLGQITLIGATGDVAGSTSDPKKTLNNLNQLAAAFSESLNALSNIGGEPGHANVEWIGRHIFQFRNTFLNERGLPTEDLPTEVSYDVWRLARGFVWSAGIMGTPVRHPGGSPSRPWVAVVAVLAFVAFYVWVLAARRRVRVKSG